MMLSHGTAVISRGLLISTIRPFRPKHKNIVNLSWWSKVGSRHLEKFVIMRILCLVAIVFFLISPCRADGAQRIKTVIGFEENSSRLSAEALAEMDVFKQFEDEYVVEKIDIIALCAPGEQSYHTLKLSRERSYEVYNYLTTIIPDDGDYEMRYFDPLSPVVDEEQRSDCVVITAYLLKKSPPGLVDPTRQLFPEEFPDYEAPKSMKAISQSGTKSKSAKGSGEKFVMENIYFEGNSAWYTDDSESTLNEVVAYLKANKGYQVKLIGHVNGKMGRKYLKDAARTNPERKVYKNAEHLSLARAEQIRDYLVANGIDESRITCEGKGGKERMYKKPKSEKQHQANRRIEILVIR